MMLDFPHDIQFIRSTNDCQASIINNFSTHFSYASTAFHSYKVHYEYSGRQLYYKSQFRNNNWKPKSMTSKKRRRINMLKKGEIASFKYVCLMSHWHFQELLKNVYSIYFLSIMGIARFFVIIGKAWPRILKLKKVRSWWKPWVLKKKMAITVDSQPRTIHTRR